MEPNSDLVSVVIPAYNAEKFVGAAIDSVLSQTHPRVELIVVDDGSTDETARVAKAYGDRLRYVSQDNALQAAARNRGVSESRGQVLAFLDADDVWRSDKLDKQLALFARDPGLGLVYCAVEEIDEQGRSLAVREACLRGQALEGILLGGTPGGVCGSTPLIPRHVLETVGGFDVSLPPCEDTDLFWRVAAHYRIDYVDEPLVRYRVHPGNAHRDIARTTRAWKRLYAKALRHPEVRRKGFLFAARCRGRLFHMLAGDHALAGRILAACGYAFAGAAAWPPAGLKAVWHAARLLKTTRSARALCL